MKRKGIARETLEILKRGSYELEGETTDISKAHQCSVEHSVLVTPEEGKKILSRYEGGGAFGVLEYRTENCSAVDAILKLAGEGKAEIGVLNFASAKNPGGGFINGAMAQEESLAASSGLYETLTAHREYYENNRICPSMMYTDHGIYSPDVVFFRNGKFSLLKEPVTASVLTLPAVNMGQVKRKGEDVMKAEGVMKQRMKLALALFAEKKDRNLILGAYGCGVFRNDPKKIALWWKELLSGGFAGCFDSVFFAVLDCSEKKECFLAFTENFS